MIVSFKSWFYKEESEDWYDSPDESLMQKILRNPISALPQTIDILGVGFYHK
jgi:hypothetical protein